MKIGTVIDPRFQQAFTKLVTADLPLSVAFKLKKTVKLIDEASTDYQSTRISKLKKYAVLDENGEIKPDASGIATFLSDELREAFFKELQTLHDVEVDIPKISIKDLEGKVAFSVRDLALLEDLIQD